MARDPDALKISKWAATGDVEDPEDGGIDRSIGWDISHSQPGGSLPKREHVNELHREETALGVEINVHGAGLEWDSSISYEHPALVTGSDALLYVSVQDSTNVDPVTDSGESHWKPLNTSPPNASTTERGIVELATDSEVATGIDTTKAVTPAGLASKPLPSASIDQLGIVQLATNTEVADGTDTQRAVTPAGLASKPAIAASTTLAGVVELATNSEVATGTDATRAITPAGLASLGYLKITVSDSAPTSSDGNDGDVWLEY